jgi:hypothetical protein
LYCQCNNCIASASIALSVQVLYCQCKYCIVSAIIVLLVQELYCQCNNCIASASIALSVPVLYCQCKNCIVTARIILSKVCFNLCKLFNSLLNSFTTINRYCYKTEGNSKNAECPVCSRNLNKLGQHLPYAHCANSKLICHISGQALNEHNPPMMLPNGYVYGCNVSVNIIVILKIQQNGIILKLHAFSKYISMKIKPKKNVVKFLGKV